MEPDSSFKILGASSVFISSGIGNCCSDVLDEIVLASEISVSVGCSDSVSDVALESS